MKYDCELPKMKKKKETNNYSVFNNILFAIKDCFKFSPQYTIILPITIFLTLFLTFLGLFQIRYIIDSINSQDSLMSLIVFLTGIAVIFMTVRLVNNFLSSIIEIASRQQWYKMRFRGISLAKDVDYDEIIEPSMKTKITQHLNDSSSRSIEVYSSFLNVINSVASAIIYGSLISTLHPLIIVGLVLMAILYYVIKKPLAELQKKMEVRGEDNNRKFSYVTRIACDLQNAKEMRAFCMGAWIDSITQDCLIEHKSIHSKIQWATFKVGIMHLAIMLLRDGFAYFFLIESIFAGKISVGEFTVIFTSIVSFSATVNGFSDIMNELNKSSLFLSRMRDMINYKSKHTQTSKTKIPTSAPEIEFINVSYNYPNANTFAIKDINLKIMPGEKIALVGNNGAGKTTFVKLLCGLLIPTTGQIKINGYSIDEYSIKEYYSLFSVVFQDIEFFPISIAEIVSTNCSDKIDRSKVIDALSKAGLKEKIEALEKGIDTQYGREYNENGVYFSGGEKQKLALARAIYLNRPVLVLDEPTSSLDPMAEQNMYINYNNVSSKSTSFFISHRLASTRFCDKILVLKKGKIVETGSHEELMELKDEYYNMFTTQAKYYN